MAAHAYWTPTPRQDVLNTTCIQLSVQPEAAKNLFEVLLVCNHVHTASTES